MNFYAITYETEDGSYMDIETIQAEDLPTAAVNAAKEARSPDGMLLEITRIELAV